MAEVLGKRFGPIGFGLMGFTWRPNPPPMEEAIAALKVAADKGLTLWNGGEFYGTPEYNSMTLLKSYFEKYPEDADKITIIIKGAVDVKTLKPDGSPEGIRRSADNILAQLGGKKKLDVFGIARRDVNTDFQETLSILKKEYVDTGKIGGVALSECSVKTIEEAVKILPIQSAEVELSLFSPDILNNGVAAALAKHNIPVVAYSPLGRGMLTGRFKVADDFKDRGFAAFFPRFQGEAFAHNYKLVQTLEDLAVKKSCTASQLAIAWTVAVGRQPGQPAVIPIPGASKASQVEENAKFVELSDDEFNNITELVNSFETAGRRYPDGVPMEI
ncbi:hypothetical protein S7711_05608 [Stachybotrys chartarum IBT 7711]|uniref:NADP-dependent oxidoreductase domain-containing protein n=1 Tax=Stachybotrys chartarum (strain CBS 109288 / IBT 7711) TaxID=1280523 RepID=A0A084B4Q7_STACB|nr:hypothetical protein S7711_05608 [Stachybotrys chartarum IBT 7711]KFA52503.1 hypothetical protein S40293_05645 [Stachybotrys chartarum IBT 40293]KFA75983.1 hypothetical protein S40288_05638 [Stachybotrys chartarum IBT 40288]